MLYVQLSDWHGKPLPTCASALQQANGDRLEASKRVRQAEEDKSSLKLKKEEESFIISAESAVKEEFGKHMKS